MEVMSKIKLCFKDKHRALFASRNHRSVESNQAESFSSCSMDITDNPQRFSPAPWLIAVISHMQ